MHELTSGLRDGVWQNPKEDPRYEVLVFLEALNLHPRLRRSETMQKILPSASGGALPVPGWVCPVAGQHDCSQGSA